MKNKLNTEKEIEITKEDFEDYEQVRNSGSTNMFNIKAVVNLSNNLTKDKVIAIIEGYKKLMEEYPDVRNK